MDGFHLHDDELARLGRSDRKGAPDTFDVAGYVALLRRLRIETGHTVYAPAFDRSAASCRSRARSRCAPSTGSCSPRATTCSTTHPAGSGVLPLLDEAWFVETDEALRLSRLVERHIEHGKPPELAQRWATVSDQANADLVARTRVAADVIVEHRLSADAPAARLASCNGGNP